MFLNRLVSAARTPSNVRQLTNLIQKCAISTSPVVCAKLEKQRKPQELFSQQKDSNPVERINEKLTSNDIGRMFAIVQLCGKQFKVTAGDVILVEGFWEPSNGDKLRLDKVLVAGALDFSLIGRPLLQKGLVDVQATVIEKSLSHTRTHFKKKKRKQFMRINFQRQPTTMIRINSIELTNLVDSSQSQMNDDIVY